MNDGELDSNVATISIIVLPVNDAPVALAQSVSTPDSVVLPITLAGTDVEGDPLTFHIVEGPLHGQLSGTAPDVSYLSEAGYAGEDSFTFKVNDGMVDSGVVTVQITVNPVAPVITAEPVGKVVNPGARVELTVANTGSRPLTYIWRKGGEVIQGVDAATLVLDPVTEDDEALYQVSISNVVDTEHSQQVFVGVNDPVIFTAQPLSQAVSETDEVVFSVAVTGTGPFDYQWRKDGMDLPGEDGPELRIASAVKTDEGGYDVLVSNVVGDFPSQTATLEVVEGAPRIVQQPGDQILRTGDALHLEVSALGRPPLRYQWRFNGRPIAGATQRTLSLWGAGLKQAGRYSVGVTSSE